MRAADAARLREEAKRRANEPVTLVDLVLFNGFMLFMLAVAGGGIAVPLWSVWKWSGGWKIAAAVPAAVVAFVVLRILVDTARDPTSHNLWPFEIIEFGGVALGIMCALSLARRIFRVAG